MKNTKKKLYSVMLLSIFTFMFSFTNVSISANEIASKIIYDLDGEIITDTNIFNRDMETNLLLDADQNSLLNKENNGTHYQLESVTVTRHRRPVQIKYYVGDYTSYEYIGTDAGYIDFRDSINQYLLNINGINAKFETNIPTGYRLFPLHQGQSLTTAPEYNGMDDTYVLEVLVAEVINFPGSVLYYQNRQDMQNPNPIGKDRATIDSNEEFWHANTIGRAINAVNGQVITINSSYGLPASYTATTVSGISRTGQRAYVGYYQNASGEFIESATITMDRNSPDRIMIAAFYEVDDYGSLVEALRVSSGVTTSVSVGFQGSSVVTWKSPSTSETLLTDNEEHIAKLAQYPFHLNADAFDEPEFNLSNLPNNWMLSHKIDVTYHYLIDDTIVPSPPNPIIPERPNPIIPELPSPVVPIVPEDQNNKVRDTLENDSQTTGNVQTADSLATRLLVSVLLMSACAIVLIRKKK